MNKMFGERRCLQIALLTTVLVAGLCIAAESTPAPATPAPATTRAAATQPAPLPPGVKAIRDIQYVPDGDESQRLDLYLPEAPSKAPMPLVVWIHGGGWRGGNKSGCASLSMVPRGYAAASVEYRFSSKAIFPAQIQDCQAAIRWLRANAARYNIDPQRIGVWGSSAGGHLVALLGTSGGKNAFAKIGGNEDQSDRVQAVCDFFGPADFTRVVAQAEADTRVKNIFPFNTPKDPYSCLIGANLSDTPKAEAVSPMHYVSSDNAPILIMHGTSDGLVPFAQSDEFAAALKKAGVPTYFQVIPNAGHGGPAFSLPPVQRLIRTFFDKYLKGEEVNLELLPESAVTVTSPQPTKAK